MSHIIYKHSTYLVCVKDVNGVVAFVEYTNGDAILEVYEVINGNIPSINGYSKEELVKLYNKVKGK